MAYNMNYNKMKVVLPLTLKKDEEVEKIQSSSFSGYETKSTIPKEMNYVNDTVDRPLNEICHWAYKEDEENKLSSTKLLKKVTKIKQEAKNE